MVLPSKEQQKQDYEAYERLRSDFEQKVQELKERSQITFETFIQDPMYGYEFTKLETEGLMEQINLNTQSHDEIYYVEKFYKEWERFIKDYESDFGNVRERYVGRYCDRKKRTV